MAEVTRHPVFYFCDGSVIFQLGNILYRLHMSLLESTSPVFTNMFSMPVRNDQAREGTNDENPIRLGEPFTVKKFDHLLKWFYRCNPEWPTLETVTSILELATFLEMNGARAFAIQALQVLAKDHSPAFRLSLGLSFRITDWIEPAFKQLLTTPAHHISLDDYSLLNPPVAHLVMSTQAKIRSLRLAIASNPFKPVPHDETCLEHAASCQRHWEVAWWDGFARHYLHPDHPITSHGAVSMFETTAIIGVTTACRLRAVHAIKEQRFFEREDDIVENALQRLKDFEGTVFKV